MLDPPHGGVYNRIKHHHIAAWFKVNDLKWWRASGYAILREMKVDQGTPSWIINWMRRSGLNHFAASMLDGFEPAAIVLAQLAYLADPFLGGQQRSLTQLGAMLEDPSSRAVLISELDKDSA